MLLLLLTPTLSAHAPRAQLEAELRSLRSESVRLRMENESLRVKLEFMAREKEIAEAGMCMFYDALQRRKDPRYKPAVESRLYFSDRAEYERQLSAFQNGKGVMKEEKG